jgi:hypothetical protein
MAKRPRPKRVWRDWIPRQPTGEGGAKVSEYQRTTVRLPPDVRELLERTAKAEGRQQWRVLVDAIRLYAQCERDLR